MNEELRNRIAAMTPEQLQARAAEIDATQLSTLSAADASTLAEEREAIGSRIAKLRLAAFRGEQRRQQVLNNPAPGHQPPANPQSEQRSYTTESPEYRSAILKLLKGNEPLSAEEQRAAYTAVTTDTTNGAAYVLPRQMVNDIWDLIDEQHSVLGDITMYRTGTILEIPKRTAITQGDAATVAENAANDDEINVFAKVTLNGKDFSKTLHISYAMARMSIDAFESFLVNEIAERLGAALARDIFTQILADYDSTNNIVTSTAVKAASFKDITTALGLLPGNGRGPVVVYGKRATIWAYLVGLVDTTGRPIFQPNAQAGQEGTLIGFQVKVDDAVPANTLLIGYPGDVVGNTIQDIMVESARDIEKHVITYSGYARFECKLMNPKSFVRYNIKQS